MAQFDVHAVAGYGLVVDCHNDFMAALTSRIVAPLRETQEPTVSTSRLNPLVEIDGAEYRIATQFIRAVDRRQLGPAIGSLLAYESDIKAAIDLVASGF